MLQEGGYTEAAEEIIEIATEFNTRKDFFPVFGIGLGMDVMLHKSSDGHEISRDCQLESLAVSLILSKKSY